MRLLFGRGMKKSKKPETKILFTTDLHGSEGVWKKFLYASVMLKVDVPIAGGDLTGKMLVPIVKKKDGKYEYYLMGKNHTINSSKLKEAEKSIRGIGYYPYITDENEVAELRESKKKLDEAFVNVMKSTLKRWFDMIPGRLPDKKKVIVCPGNDDRFEIDDVINSHEHVINGEGKVINLDGVHEMISTGWVDPTPWKTPREEEEDKLEQRLENYISKINDIKNAIFNFHSPPYLSKLDEAPLLDEHFNPVIRSGEIVKVPVGSKAVRKVIEKYQPILGLHGHIHECSGSIKIGRTHCVNPGSEYAEGVLRAFLIEFKGEKLIRLQRVEG